MATLTIKGKYDGRGVKAAKKDLTSFEKFSTASISRMKLGAAVAVAAGIAFAKQSIDAALAESKAQAILSTNMRNSGFGYASAAADEYVSKLQLLTNISEEQLRPAMGLAIRTTKDFTAAQQLLSLATDVSVGSGKDMGSVMDALTKGINGNRKGLLTLGSGMSKSYLLTADMSDIISALTRKFNGSAAKAVESLGGKFENFKLVVGEAQETVGTGLVNALAILATRGGASIDSLNAKVNALAQGIADVAVGAADAAAPSSGGGNWFSSLLGVGMSTPLFGGPLKAVAGVIQGLGKRGAGVTKLAQERALEASRENRRGLTATKGNLAQYSALKKVADAKAVDLKVTKKSNTAKAKSLALAKLEAKYNLELIGLAAAKRNSTGQTGLLGRISDLTTIAQSNAGLSVSAAALAGAKNTQIPNVTVNVSGSVITERNLMDAIRRDVTNMMSDRGRWGDIG